MSSSEWVALEILKSMVPAMKLWHVKGTEDTEAQLMRQAVKTAKAGANELLDKRPQ